MLSNKLNIWIGLAGFTAVLAGCPGDDSSGDTNSSFNPTTGVATGSTGNASSDGAATETGVATTDAESTGDPQTTTGTVTCDPACADNEECIDGVCFPTGEDESSGDPPPGNSDYGPCTAGCPAGEMPVGLGDPAFCFCSPSCDGMTCPAPNEGTAPGECVLTFEMGAPPTQCALTCMTSDMCPTGASCEGGVCQHPA